MKKTLTVLKLGGSIITEKKKSGRLRRVVIRRLAREIRSALKARPQQLIIVHGAGGKAHTLAHRYNLVRGARNERQIFGSLDVHRNIILLRGELASIFWRARLPVVPIQTSSIFSREKSKLIFHGQSITQTLLMNGSIPLLHADMIPDAQKNFSILSGDNIVAVTARKLSADKLLFATDVDGVYTADPNHHKDARLISRISAQKLKEYGETQVKATKRDISGAMIGKLASVKILAPRVPVQIFNGLKPGLLGAALKGKRVGTLIKN